MLPLRGEKRKVNLSCATGYENVSLRKPSRKSDQFDLGLQFWFGHVVASTEEMHPTHTLGP
jgi:hypothetical protein